MDAGSHRSRKGAAPVIRRLARPFAISGLGAALIGAVGAITLRIVDPVPQIPSTFGFGDVALFGFCVLGVAFAAVGALLVVRRPGNVIGWLMVMIGVGYAVGVFWAAVTFSLTAHPGVVGWLDVRVAGWLTVLFTSLGGVVFFLGFIFPTGRGHDATWDRWLKISAILSPFMFVSVFLLRPGPLHVFPTIDNPFPYGFDLRPWFGDHVSERISAMAVVLLPLLVWSVVARYRKAGMAERQQLKWFGLAIGLAIAALAVAGASATVSDDPPQAGLALFGFFGALVPVAIGVAILRYHLYDIDSIISRTVGYATITGVLAVVFAVVIPLVGGLLSSVAGGLVPSSQTRTIAVAVSTLVVFALFSPVRRRVQRTVDRRFDRARYDADQTVRAFAGRLRRDVDLGSVSEEIVQTTILAVHPTQAGIWLRSSRH